MPQVAGSTYTIRVKTGSGEKEKTFKAEPKISQQKGSTVSVKLRGTDGATYVLKGVPADKAASRDLTEYGLAKKRSQEAQVRTEVLGRCSESSGSSQIDNIDEAAAVSTPSETNATTTASEAKLRSPKKSLAYKFSKVGFYSACLVAWPLVLVGVVTLVAGVILGTCIGGVIGLVGSIFSCSKKPLKAGLGFGLSAGALIGAAPWYLAVGALYLSAGITGGIGTLVDKISGRKYKENGLIAFIKERRKKKSGAEAEQTDASSSIE